MNLFQPNYPELEVSILDEQTKLKYTKMLSESGIFEFSPYLQKWTSSQSNKALAYLTHGIFRYFGKFPPPVARHLINTHSNPGDRVLDPMCGSGTSCLEALLLKRKPICYDVNPLSVLLTRVKITRIDRDIYFDNLNHIMNKLGSDQEVEDFQLNGLRDATHWFLPQTISSLSRIRKFIGELNTDTNIKEAMFISFLSIVRKVSKATSQQGRLFLDISSAITDATQAFYKKAIQVLYALDELPFCDSHDAIIENKSVFQINLPPDSVNLIICHPPYFNSYKYSSINSLELAWLGIDHSEIRKDEVREAFKVGKPEKVADYVTDMEKSLNVLSKALKPGGMLALMIGDTVMKGKYIPVTKMLLERVDKLFEVQYSALRVPQFTEASWAASQRRGSADLGINICDFVIILKKRENGL